jgi:hypothetical protein
MGDEKANLDVGNVEPTKATSTESLERCKGEYSPRCWDRVSCNDVFLQNRNKNNGIEHN